LEVRASTIASLAWCQVKAKAFFDGKFEIQPDFNLLIGELYHQSFGFGTELELRRELDGVTVTGHPDYVGSDFILEFKVTEEKYPTRFLMGYAHLQCKVYCWLAGVKRYIIFVYNPFQKKSYIRWGRVSLKRFEDDLKLRLKIFKGEVEPIPTTWKFKCRNCEYKGECKNYLL